LDFDTLAAIRIVTNDAGPRVEDVFWRLEWPGTVCYAPGSDEIVVHRLIDQLKSLPRESDSALVASYRTIAKANGSAENAVFTVWTRPRLPYAGGIDASGTSQ
jgi:hypothetical protein